MILVNYFLFTMFDNYHDGHLEMIIPISTTQGAFINNLSRSSMFCLQDYIHCFIILQEKELLCT